MVRCPTIASGKNRFEILENLETLVHKEKLK